MSKADHRALRAAVIEQVLGTDMKKHFNILSRFQVSLSLSSLYSLMISAMLTLN